MKKEGDIIRKIENNINYKINIDKSIKNKYNRIDISIFIPEDYIYFIKKNNENELLTLNDVSEKYINTSKEYIDESEKLDIVNNEHDKIMRMILDNKECAAEIINKVLKKEVYSNEIEKYNSSYITRALKNRECDIVYKLKDKEIFFLIEHQTKIDYKMSLRMYEYSLEIIRSAIRGKKINNQKIELPAVIPIVLYTGNKKWDASKRVSEIQTKLLGYNQEIDRYNVVDVNEYTNEELLKGKTFVTKAMLIEKTKSSKEFKEILKEIYIRMNNKEDEELLEMMTKIILGKTMKRESIEEVIKNLRKGDGNMLAVIDTLIAEKKRERILGKIEGKREGKREGKIEGMIQVVKTMLKKKMPVELISEITKMPIEEIEKIQKSK